MLLGEKMKKYLFSIILFLLLFLATGCKKSIVGKWKSIDTDNEYYYIFNSDKTCAYEMTVAKLNCTYEESDSQLNILFDGNEKTSTYEYRFEDKTLIIKDSSGKDNKFVREK